MKDRSLPNGTIVGAIFFSIIMLFLSLVFGLMIIQAPLSKKISERIMYLAELVDDNSNLEDQLVNSISSINGVFDVEYLSRDIALQKMSAEIAVLKEQGDFENPFSNYISFRIDGNMGREGIPSITSAVSALDGVTNVHYRSSLINRIKTIVRMGGLLSLLLTSLLLLVSYTLIYSFIRSLLLEDRRELKTMQLVGAKDDFIKKPYRMRMMRLNRISMGIYILVYVLILSVLYYYFPVAMNYVSWYYMLITMVVVLLFMYFVNRYTVAMILTKLLK